MKKISIKKVIAASTISLVIVQMVYLAVEPTVALATAVTSNVVVTLNVTSGVTIANSTSNVATMTPNISVSQHKSVGSTAWTVTTNSATGYTLAVKASTSPALKNGSIDSFADYTEATAGTPDLWGGIASGSKEFGYNAYGATDTPTATWGTPSGCGNTGTGVVDAAGKFRGFSTTDVTIASRAGVTPPAGVVTNVCFAAEENNVYAASGAYTATITATATAA